MIQEYVNKLIENLPDNIKENKTPLLIDLVLDGGIFNGSYLVGALYFLKEMEKRNYIKIERMSGCSIGSIAAFLYLIDSLDLMSEVYSIFHSNFKQSFNLSILKDLKKFLDGKIPDDICSKVNDKLFICYYNLKKNTKIVKSSYRDVDDIINTIIKSSYVPYLIDGNLLYQNKAFDGVFPYIFKTEPDKKILYLDLFGYDKIFNLLNVKNEKTNYHRILSGLLDIHSFFIKQNNTHMCSYVNNWHIYHISSHYLKQVFEKFCLYLMKILFYLKINLSDNIKESILFKLSGKIIHEIYILILEKYCL
jgi:hypothetical protein